MKKLFSVLLLFFCSTVCVWGESSYDAGRNQDLNTINYRNGLKHFNGIDTPVNHSDALKYFRDSAKRGYIPSQKMLSEVYLAGKEIPIDFVRAYAWLKTAGRSNNDDEMLSTRLKLLEKCMTHSQLFKAEKLAEQYQEEIRIENKVAASKFINSLGMNFVYIKPGSFARNGTKITNTRGYYIQTTEVTQRDWETVMGTCPWEGYEFVKSSPENPAVYISWLDCQKFIGKLNKKEGINKYRLPTEAEWEYAARGGSESAYCFGDDAEQLDEYAWYNQNTWNIGEKYAHAVALKKPNQFGLYDMHGNVWEWCADWYGEFPKKDTIDPKGPKEGDKKIHRGGSWYYDAARCTASGRYSLQPDYKYFSLGFRLARSM